MSKLLNIKNIRRMGSMAGLAIYQLAPGLSGLLLSLVIVRFYGEEWWGQIVILQLILFFSMGVLNYGQKEYLLKAFSERPAKISSYWQFSLATRSILLPLPLVYAWFFSGLGFYHCMQVSVWIIARYVSVSYEPYIVYSRRFIAGIFTELIPSLLLAGWLFLKQAPSIDDVLFAISLSYLLKVLLSLWAFRELLTGEPRFAINTRLFREAFPFAALAILGLLQSKADLLVASLLLDENILARYQVLMAFLLLLQSIPAFIFSPFLKNLYRLNDELIISLQPRISLAGLLISIAGTGAVAAILQLAYHIYPGPAVYLLSFAYVFSTYLFFLNTYRLFKAGQSRTVMLISLASVIVNVICCFLFIPAMQVTGAMLANVISQLVIGVLYAVAVKRFITRENPDMQIPNPK